MKQLKISIALLLILATMLSFVACDRGKKDEQPEIQHIDYVADLKLDMSSPTLKQEVTVKTYIDGDTTHFYFPDGGFEDGVFKARYLAINTPESTGKVEEWGKAASNFTKEKLMGATSIIIESDDRKWNADSTGSRYLVWVWYKPQGSEEYRNLNLEILQNGLAIASNSANNRYGNVCMAAIDQAKAEKLYVHSGKKDPDFHYGEAFEMTIKELRANIDAYNGKKVAFEGVVVKDHANMIYVEEYDAENNMYFGMAVYYGTGNLPGKALGFLAVGNRVRIVGTVMQFEGSWQVSGLSYSLMRPDHADNVQMISQGHAPAYSRITPAQYSSENITIEVGDEMRSFKYVDMALWTSVEMMELTVNSVYTTPSGTSAGAMTLTCTAPDGTEVSVRTTVIKDDNGETVTADRLQGETIDVRGIMDYYSTNQTYQVLVFSFQDIQFYG